MERSDTLVLGAGLCGLSCAYHLGEGSRYRLLERERAVGGLARTHRRPGGFLCDGTGHWLHLAHDYTRQLVADLLGDNLELRSRRSRVYSHGRSTRYPFQAHLHGLPTEVIVECLLGLMRRPEGTPANYREWIEHNFGAGICRHFMVPYNRKVYGVPLETLAAGFAERYIPRPDLEVVLRGAFEPAESRLGYNARFSYPRQGGIGALAESLHARLERKAELGREPVALDLTARVARLADGERLQFGRLVSTIPLPELVKLCADVPEVVRAAAGRLRASTVQYYDVGVKGGPGPADYHWIYFPEPEFGFYRVGSYTAVEPSLAPAGMRSYYVEFGGQGREEDVLTGLRTCGLLADDDEVVFMEPHRIEPAYVLFDEHYEAARALVLDWLATQEVTSVGRYGRWAYTGMEDALLEGKEAALWSSRS
jgi:protoporphyrinogen oxidase